MLRFTTLIALSIAAAPVLAAPATQIGDDHGQRFEYSTELLTDGIIHISGVMLGSREQFSLDVRRNGRVSGRFGERPVEFMVSKAVRNRVAAQLGESTTIASSSN